jgi:hypothetical protein
MPSIEYCLENAYELAQEFISQCSPLINAPSLSPDAKDLFEKAREYRIRRGVEENYRENGKLTVKEEAEAEAARQAFAQAYKTFREKHELSSAAG